MRSISLELIVFSLYLLQLVAQQSFFLLFTNISCINKEQLLQVISWTFRSLHSSTISSSHFLRYGLYIQYETSHVRTKYSRDELCSSFSPVQHAIAIVNCRDFICCVLKPTFFDATLTQQSINYVCLKRVDMKLVFCFRPVLSDVEKACFWFRHYFFDVENDFCFSLLIFFAD